MSNISKLSNLISVTLFNACLELGYCPAHFRETITVVLRNPGKDDYTQPKAYRPIALLNTLGKALEATIASRLTCLADTYQLLSSRHTGGRKLASTDHAIHLLLQRIHKAWADGQMASLLLLDVSGAFDSVSRPRLLHNLRKRRVDHGIIRWIDSFLTNRSSTIKLQEYTTPSAPIQTGIPQGVVLEQHVTRWRLCLQAYTLRWSLWLVCLCRQTPSIFI